MIRRYFIKPFRNWFKNKIEKLIKEIDSKNNKNRDLPFTVFYPHSKKSLSYVIPKSNENLIKCELGLPVPPERLWLGYGRNMQEYLYSGKDQIEIMIKLLEKSGLEFEKCKRILELGCSTGRMIRWLKPFSDKMEIWGTDISSEHIYWANKYLNPPFNFATTTTIPHLPFEDQHFDVIYAGSVFTHIDDLADSWFLELKRILTSDGRIYITIHDRHSIDLIEKRIEWRDSMLADLLKKNNTFRINRENFGKFVGLRGPDSQVFYDREYFEKSIGNKYEIISYTPEAYGYQTGVVLKKKN